MDAGRQWWPALDGLRGIAVAAVLVYHHDDAWLPGGYLGVSLFFTISGFLITNLLVRERAETGRIDIGQFWVRRARRLAPTALVGLVLAGLVAWITRPPAALGPIAGDLRAAVLNLANWRQAVSPITYGDTLSTPSPVTHYWSLAIEEQFYLVYPLLAGLALRWGRRWLAGLLLVATAASVAAQLTLTDVNRAYLGTDARLAELTIGGLLALVLIRRRTSPRPGLDIAGGAALVALAAAWATADLGPGLFDGGLVAHAVASAVVLAAAVGGRNLSRLLGWRPLVWVGALSYGLYVVHFPLYLLLSSDRTHLDGVTLLAVRLSATVLLATVVHHLVENPVRWRRALPGWQGGLALASGLGIVLVLATSLPHVGRDDAARLEVALDERSATVVTMPASEVRLELDPTATTAPSPTVTTTAGRPTASPPRPVAGPDRALRMLVVGDSTAMANGRGLQQWAAEAGLATVDYVAAPSCSFSQDGEYMLRDGWTLAPVPACLTLLERARAHAAESSPDVIVVFIGSIQIADWLYAGDTEVRSVGDQEFDQRYVDAAHRALATLEQMGAPVLLATLPVPDWDPTVQWPGGTIPGSGPLTINDAGRTGRLNQLNHELMSAHLRTRMFPYAELISAPDGSVSTDLRPDGMHLDPDKVPGLMRDGLEALLRDAYRHVLRSEPQAIRPGRTMWTP